MASLFAVEANHAPQSVCANDEAPLNISAMLVTLDTSHFETSPLNCFDPRTRLPFASTNNQLMSVTAETSQDQIGLRRPWEQSVDNCRHFSMAAWSSAPDLGAHPVVGYTGGTWLGSGRGIGVGVKVSARVRIRVGPA